MSETLDRLQSAIADRYRVERELGAGGMATVFLAQDLKHGREVAIKVLHPELGASIGSERFDREIRLAAKLQHPHILGLYDSGEANGLLYYVMPFVKGESLRDRLDRESQLPIEDAIHITLEVADALGYAHEHGVVHRDIKPENILLSGGHCLVADFGIARAATEAGEKLTQTGMAVGTPLYMSPEQSMGDAVGPTADIYSLGCVLYEMLAGTPPFTGPNARAIMARHAMTPVPGLQEVRASVPDEVEEAVMAALAKVPADRPQTAKAFCEIMGTPLGATATRRANIRVTSTRHPAAGVRMTMEEFEAMKRAEAPARMPAWRRPLVWAVVAVVLVAAGLGVWRLRTGAGGSGAIPAGADPHDIAVLYFEDQSQKQDLGYVADGLTEGLISALGSVPGLSVVSKGGVGQFRGGKVARDSIARALQVGTLVMGSVEPENDSIRVTVRILDDAGTELDKATFKKPGTDLIALSDSLSQEVAGLIRRRVGVEAQLRKTRLGTGNTEAWAMFQRALQARRRGDSLFKAGDAAGFTAAYRAADSTALLAARLDDTWADPIVLRGELDYWISRRASDDPGQAIAAIDSGMARAAEAFALDKNNAAALELRGALEYWKYLNPFEPDSARRQQLLAQGQADLEAATRLNPSAASAYAMLSHLYTRLPDKSMTDVLFAANKALDMDAYLSNADVVIYRLALGYYDLNQSADASKWCTEGRRRFPSDPRFVQCQLQIMTSKFVVNPDPALAWRLSDSVVALTPDGPDRRYARLYTRVLTAGVLARAGQLDSARRVLKSTKPDPEVDPSNDLANTAAFVWLLAGDTTEALNQIKLYLIANPDRTSDFRDDPNWWFRGVSEDPRYQAIVGLPK